MINITKGDSRLLFLLMDKVIRERNTGWDKEGRSHRSSERQSPTDREKEKLKSSKRKERHSGVLI